MINHFPYEWHLNFPAKTIDYHGSTVFSCFAGGGGSSMGYKLAGYDVLGCLELDKKVNEVYTANLHPKYNYNEDIRDFVKRKNIPNELFNLDILDGSPPCSSFSMSGARDKYWGKEKKFREGQKTQILDSLFFDFIELGNLLQPKIIIVENVPGIMLGKAASYSKNYVFDILKAFEKNEYIPQLFLLNAQNMGVPQNRKRVFFIAMRKDLMEQFRYQKDFFTIIPKLNLQFDFKQIKFGKIRSEKGIELNFNSKTFECLKYKLPTDHFLGNITLRLFGKKTNSDCRIVHDSEVCPTIRASNYHIRYFDDKKFSKSDLINVSSFPIDFNFLTKNISMVNYIIGMSVPPVMMAQIAYQIYKQWILKMNKNENKQTRITGSSSNRQTRFRGRKNT